MLASAGSGAHARDIINAPFDPNSIDILQVTERIRAKGPEVEIETSPDINGNVGTMRLSAISRGPVYRWMVFSIRNSSPIPLEYVIVSQRKSFVGSGVLWPHFGSRQLIDAQASPGLPPSSENIRTADAYSFRVEANQTVTYALEVASAWPDDLSLWQRDAFDQRRQQVSFFHGLLLGIATLVSIYISSLFIIRRKLVFPSAALFSWCSTVFLGIEFGYLPVLTEVPVAAEHQIRAVVEALMAFGLLACLYTFVELRKRMPVAGYTLLLVLAGAAALVGYAYSEPAIGAGLARIALLLGAVTGLAIVLTMSRLGVIRAQVAVSAWLLIGFWSVLAALGAAGVIEHEMIGPGLAAGLVLVNLLIAFTVTQYAFDAGVISSRFFEDSGRRALALAGSEQCVWDWREDQGWLYIGPELEPSLGIKRGSLAAAGLKGWLELMHPGDRPAYVAAVEAAIQRGKGTFAQEFRLRRKDGTYRWYQLRARAIPGDQGRAARCIGTLADITTLKRSEERLLYDAVQDRLTGLPNRALFMDRLDRAMRHARSDDGVRLFVTVVDIDRFKNVNDGLGHSVGDSLLLTMARRLQQFVGPEDTLARLSGDQFGLIVDAASPERKMHEVSEEIRQAVARPVELNLREVFLTASVGVTEYLRDVMLAADLLKDAEIALYEAKRRGKNKIEFFRPTMRDDRSKLIEIESDLRRALERNEIEVAYQPIYNIETDKLSGFEALVRWRHKKHGLLGPDEFIGVAEETGIIVELGRYVMGEAARQLGIWQRVLRPSDPIFVSVNLSSRQVLDQNLVDDVKTIMSREDVARGSLKLELTESLVMENVELSAQVLAKLNDIGVAILCDDFGTGHSSLANLQRFSFDTLKIDKSFIDADPENDAAMVILESIIILAHDLGMQVVAEGVENKEQLERLREFECDFAQGFYFGEPLTTRAVVETLGGKPHMFEQKRSRQPRGFLGKLMRAGVRLPGEEPADASPKLTSDPRDFAPPPQAPSGAERPPAPRQADTPAPSQDGVQQAVAASPPSPADEEMAPDAAGLRPVAGADSEQAQAADAGSQEDKESPSRLGRFFRRKETPEAAEPANDDARARDEPQPAEGVPAASGPDTATPAPEPSGDGQGETADGASRKSAIERARERMAQRAVPPPAEDAAGPEPGDAKPPVEAEQDEETSRADAENLQEDSVSETVSRLGSLRRSKPAQEPEEAATPEATPPAETSDTAAAAAEKTPAVEPEADQPAAQADASAKPDKPEHAPATDQADAATSAEAGPDSGEAEDRSTDYNAVAAASALSAARRGAATPDTKAKTPSAEPEAPAPEDETGAEASDPSKQEQPAPPDAVVEAKDEEDAGPADAEQTEDETAQESEDSAAEDRVEPITSGPKHASKLAKLLRRSRKSPTAAES